MVGQIVALAKLSRDAPGCPVVELLRRGTHGTILYARGVRRIGVAQVSRCRRVASFFGEVGNVVSRELNIANRHEAHQSPISNHQRSAYSNQRARFEETEQ